MQDYLSTIKTKNPDLKRGEIRGLLYIIYSKDCLKNNELIRLTGLPKTVLKEFKSSISELLKSTNKDEISLNEKGLELASQLDLRPYKWSLIQQGLAEDEAKLETIRLKYGLTPKRKYDQYFATAKSTVEKAKMLIDKDLVEGKNIALIGDDDLVSIALGLMSPNYNSIKVFDVDKDILDQISKIVEENKITKISTHLHDVRNEFAANEISRYDAVLIDPPYTKSGAKLFLHRALELLVKSDTFDGRYVLMNYGTGLRNPEDTIKVQDVINSYNLVIEDRLEKYTRYYGAETVGSASSLYVLKTTPHTSIDAQVLHSKIYTFEDIELEQYPYIDHYVFKLQKINKAILTSQKKMMKLLGEFCRKHKLKVVDTKVTKFKNQGLSFTYILSNSNLVVHTWPEKNSLHLDLITCIPLYNKEIVANTLADLFETEFLEVTQVE